MHSLWKHALVCAAIALAAIILLLMADDKQEQEAAGSSASSERGTVSEDIGDVASENTEVRVAAAARLEAHRKRIVSGLITIVARLKPHSQAKLTAENLKEPKPEVLAMTLLGKFRASEAVSILVERIDYRDPRTLKSYRFYLTAESFPAAAALVRIGMPAVGALLKKVGDPDTPKNKKARELAIWTLREILGKRLATVRLEDEIKRMKDGDQPKRQRLQDALRVLSTMTLV